MTLIRADEAGREMTKVGPSDGATRIWIGELGSVGAPGMTVGLHHHGGDEIFQVLSGTVRFHLGGENIDVGAGHFVVVPPYTEHGFKVLTEDARMQVVGEIEMGEWVTIIDPDGSRRQVEVRSTLMPWHRPPREGERGASLEDVLEGLATTSRVLDQEPEEEDDAH
jgi:mannose-6-phosphate isomerase-like protein (cupin superfamily)